MNLQRFTPGVRLMPLCLILLFAGQTVSAAVVRGRLDHTYPNGARYPAAGVAVTIYNPKYGRSSTYYAGPDGMYYLQNVPAGPNYLEVWTRDPRAAPTVYPIQVAEPYTDIPPIVVK
ncbi:MAG TPA: hypothetical protein VEH30_14385 [Terriglobales bacterium]|nr:hypothetical protein [Terriglobales bacterium]